MDPAKLAQAKKVGEHIVATLHIDKEKGTFTLTLIAKDEAGMSAIPEMTNNLAMGIANQIKMFFGIKGSIV
jgi:chemotaxis protein CheY-P-specific phosphatase CheC